MKHVPGHVSCRTVTHSPTAPLHSIAYGEGSVSALKLASPQRTALADVMSPADEPTHTSKVPRRGANASESRRLYTETVPTCVPFRMWTLAQLLPACVICVAQMVLRSPSMHLAAAVPALNSVLIDTTPRSVGGADGVGGLGGAVGGVGEGGGLSGAGEDGGGTDGGTDGGGVGGLIGGGSAGGGCDGGMTGGSDGGDCGDGGGRGIGG